MKVINPICSLALVLNISIFLFIGYANISNDFMNHSMMDGDTRISVEESRVVKAGAEGVFKRMDTNPNGVLTIRTRLLKGFK